MDRLHEWEFAKNCEWFWITEICEWKAAVKALHAGELYTCWNVIWAYPIRLEWMLMLGLFALGTMWEVASLSD